MPKSFRKHKKIASNPKCTRHYNSPHTKTTKIKESIKRRARDSLDNPREIVSAEVQNVSEAVAFNLPSLDHLGRNIRSQRQNRHRHANPVVREALPELPPEYQVTSAGERFLIHDSGIGDEKRILIFGSPDALQLLRESPHWFGDGTFKVCPRIFFTHFTVWFKIVLYLVFMLFYRINLKTHIVGFLRRLEIL